VRGSGPGAVSRSWGYGAYALHLWTVFGIALSNMLGGVTLLAWVKERPSIDPRARAVLLPLGLYSLCFLLSIAFSANPAGSLPGSRALIALLTLPLGLALVRGPAAARRIVDGLIVMAAVSGAWGLCQLFIGYGGIDHRLRGPFSHWMTFAGVLLIANLLLISQLISGRGVKSVWRWLALVVINAGLIGGLTRGAWIAAAVAIAVVLLIRAPRWLALFVLLLPALAVVGPTPVRERAESIFNLSNFSNYDRLCMIEAGWRMVRERPILGQGPRMVRERYPIYRHPTAPRFWVPHLHNNIVQLAAEQGLVATAAFIWLMAAAAWQAYRLYRRQRLIPGDGSDLYLGAFGALVAFNLAGMFEFNWGDAEVQRLALFLVALPFCASREPDAAESED
jgi:O-antigen ligase